MGFAKKAAAGWVETLWYRESGWAYLLFPLSLLFAAAAKLRRFLYRKGIFKVFRLEKPVIVVGNLSVGGTGKTPLVVWIAEFLKENGYHPGIVSRGYGGRAKIWPQWVTPESDPLLVGDEALLIAYRTRCPVAVGPKRVEAAKMVLDAAGCDIVVSDDGLQHYALGREVEIVVIDGVRRFGNGFCLPAGPLREPAARLGEADLVVCNGAARDGEFSMTLEGEAAESLAGGKVRKLAEFTGEIHAVAGIGNPGRFFEHLRRFGLRFDTRIFPDHYVYKRLDVRFDDAHPVLMTEKDAVKCRRFADDRLWCVPVKAGLDERFGEKLLTLLKEMKNGQ